MEMNNHSLLLLLLLSLRTFCEQIVLVDSNCFVTVWDISTGKQNTNFFAESKHDDEIPTCARFDDTFRRLVVSSWECKR